MNHPCIRCKAYDEPNRLQGRMNCPILEHDIALEQCNRICGATKKQAWSKIHFIRDMITGLKNRMGADER